MFATMEEMFRYGLGYVAIWFTISFGSWILFDEKPMMAIGLGAIYVATIILTCNFMGIVILYFEKRKAQ